MLPPVHHNVAKISAASSEYIHSTCNIFGLLQKQQVRLPSDQQSVYVFQPVL